MYLTFMYSRVFYGIRSKQYHILMLGQLRIFITVVETATNANDSHTSQVIGN